MRYKLTVARIGMQLACWFRAELEVSVVADGRSCSVVSSKSEAAVELTFPLGADAVE
jgi:hypothetical protein